MDTGIEGLVMRDYPTYEIQLPITFNEVEFRRKAERGEDHLWLICMDDEPGIKRFKWGIWNREEYIKKVMYPD